MEHIPGLDEWLTTEPEDDIDYLIDEYLDYLGLRNLPNVEDSLEQWFDLKGDDLNHKERDCLKDYVGEFGEV
jgi:hypothetical protein